MVAFQDVLFRITQQEQDEWKLDRRSYIIIIGKHEVKTTIITYYFPDKGTSPGFAYSQHLSCMSKKKIFLKALSTLDNYLGMINKKIDEGYHLIISGDFKSEYISLTEWMTNLGLKDMIHAKNSHIPRMCKRSHDSPIACIFGSATLQIKKVGLISFHRLCINHRGIWVDIPTYMIFGYKPPQHTQFNARCLEVNDPRVFAKYLAYLHSAFKENISFKE